MMRSNALFQARFQKIWPATLLQGGGFGKGGKALHVCVFEWMYVHVYVYVSVYMYM